MTNSSRQQGFLLIISSPSGAGKTSLARGLCAKNPSFNLSISVTTRPKRPAETDGKDYHFLSNAQFDAMTQGNQLLEYAHVFDHHYGTPKEPIDAAIKKGGVILCDIDWQGAETLRRKLKAAQVSVFILPPSLDALKTRLHTRAQDSDAVVEKRLAQAYQDSLHWQNYDYVLINDDFDTTLAHLDAIARAEQFRRARWEKHLASLVKRWDDAQGDKSR